MHKDALQMQTELDTVWGLFFSSMFEMGFLWWCTVSIKTGMYLIGKAEALEVGGHAAEDQKTNLNFQHWNKSYGISPCEVLQS